MARVETINDITIEALWRLDIKRNPDVILL